MQSICLAAMLLVLLVPVAQGPKRPSGPSKTECRDDAAQPRIVAGEGWGPVRIGAALQAVDDFLGEGRSGNKYSDVYFKDYVPKGVQVSFENASNAVHAIYFYNGQRDSKEIGMFCGRTDKGINSARVLSSWMAVRLLHFIKG